MMAAPGFESSRPGLGRQNAAESRFSPSSFQYNTRVGVALLPCVAFLLGLGGKPVLATLTVGLMIAYILDSLQLKHGAFFGVWGSLLATIGALLLSGTSLSTASTSLYVLALFVSFQLVFLVGVWASLQFKWLQLENPSVILALERLLFACIPFTASAIQAWAVVVSVGMENASFYLMVILFALYWMFSLPQPSSFRTKLDRHYGGQIAEEAMISGPLEGAFHTMTLLFLPLLFHIGAHHRRLFSSANSICDLLLLFFVPLLFQLYASTRGALWWLVKDQNELRPVRLANGAMSLLVVLLCLEVRVVFYSFGQYILIPAPWSYILVTTALIGGAGAIGMYLTGLISEELSPYLLGTLFGTAAVAGSLVVGMPLTLLPVPIISAIFFAQFCVKKSILSYFIFVVSASFVIGWFVVHNFWSLDAWLGGLPLKVVCKLLIASAVLALAVPGFARLPTKAHFLVELGLIGHALLVCHLENKLYFYGSMYYFFHDDTVYPSYLVVATSLVGLLLTWRMTQENLLRSLASWVLICLYTAKLSLLLFSTKEVLWPTVLLSLAISPPLLLYKGKVKGGSKMKPWQGLGHAGVVCVTVWVCRYTVYEAISWWTGRQPSAGVVWGFLVLLSGMAMVPIVTYHFPHVQMAKKWLLLIISLGVLLIFLQPPLPKAWPSWWDSTPQEKPDILSIYGLESSRPSWPAWLLVGTLGVSLAAVTSILPVQHIVELRLLYAVGVGVSVGIYLCVEYFTQAVIIHALLVAAVVCVTLFLVFSYLPSSSSPHYLPWVFFLFIFLLPVMYFAEGQLQSEDAGFDQEEAEEGVTALLAIKGVRTTLLGLYATLLMLIALAIKLQLALLRREKGLDKYATRGLPVSSSVFGSKRLLQQRHNVTTGGSLTARRLPAEGAWMPTIGNVSTLLCFTICLLLNIHLTGGSDRAIFLLAPILLLLNQDVIFLGGFGDRERYFPVSAAVSFYLVCSAAYRLSQEAWHGSQNSDWGLESGSPGIFFTMKNAILLLLVIPNHVMFNRFIWDYVRQSDFLLLITSPLNLPAAAITDVSTIRVLAILGMAYAFVQYLASRHIQIAGMKYI